MAAGRCASQTARSRSRTAAAADADVTVRAKAADWMAIVEGRMDPQLAYLTKRLRVSGNLQLALRLREVVL